MEKFDLVVIGAGSGGYPAAIRAAQLGASVALIEKETIGGTCLNRGCIPTKVLIASSDLFARMKNCEELGLKSGKISFNYAAISKRKDRVVTDLRNSLVQLLKGNRIKIFRGTGSFIGRNKIAVSKATTDSGQRLASPKPNVKGRTTDQKIEARNTIIATGSEPFIPDFVPSSKRVKDSRAFLEMIELPTSIIVLGGGIVGCEFACIAAQLGKEVTIIKRRDIFVTFDSDIRSQMKRYMKEKLNIRLLTGTGRSLEKIKADKNSISGMFGDEHIEADLMVVSVARRPVTKGLALEKAGVEINEAGHIKTDEFCQTNVATIYAVGDVTGGPQLAHAATSQGITAAENACKQSRKLVETIVPTAIFTSPEIGSVGLTEQEAKERGKSIKTGKYMFRALGKAVAAGETEGFVKWVADAETDQLLGGHAVGPHATDLVAEAAAAIRAELTAEEIGHTIHCHPTFSEAWMEAAHAVHGQCIHAAPRSKNN